MKGKFLARKENKDGTLMRDVRCLIAILPLGICNAICKGVGEKTEVLVHLNIASEPELKVRHHCGA